MTRRGWRRGYTAEAVRNFCERIGVGKKESLVDKGLLEFCVREDLNRKAPRVMVVLRPLKLVIDNYPEGEVEYLDAVNNPEDPDAGTRKVPFSRELFIEREDFMEAPPKQFFRLAPGREVRLRYAYFVKCVSAVKDPETGEISEVHCTYDPATRGGDAPDGRKVKATMHWVSAGQSIAAEVRLYDSLFTVANPNDVEEGKDFIDYLNGKSLEVIASRAEPSLSGALPGTHYQFERMGYFCVDTFDSLPGKPVFNRIVTLRDEWAKISKADRK